MTPRTFKGKSQSQTKAVYCHGGPLHGYGFTEHDWERRLEAERNMAAITGVPGRAMGYRAGRRPGLPSGLPKKTLEALAGWQEVRTWVPTET